MKVKIRRFQNKVALNSCQSLASKVLIYYRWCYALFLAGNEDPTYLAIKDKIQLQFYLSNGNLSFCYSSQMK